MSEVRVRFPPSPTGYLHIGGARTALYNWLFARKTGGTLILRIEDTDAERSTRASIEGIIDGLQWLGIDWDEGPHFQTDFTEEHLAAAERLVAEGKAYLCFCAKEDVDSRREAAVAAGADLKYPGRCRELPPAEAEERARQGEPYVIRFKVPRREGAVGYDDKVLGRIEQAYGEIEDFVIVRSNHMPLYLLCNVVDDIRDRISHIIRGQDHMTNTIRQVLLYEALGAPVPVFAHMPLTLDLQKKKISKRSHGEIVSVQFYRARGFLPWALCNFLVLLGWSPGTDQEIFSREELIEAFTLERINKSNSIFNYRKGDPKFFTDPKAININAQYLRSMDIEELGDLVRVELVQAGMWQDDYAGSRRAWYLHALELMRERFHTLKDFSQNGRCWFSEDYPFEDKALEKNVRKHQELRLWLPQLAERLAALPEFTHDTIEEACRALAEELGIKPGILINGSRAAVTGQLAGPSMFELLEALGRERVVSRLHACDRMFIAHVLAGPAIGEAS